MRFAAAVAALAVVTGPVLAAEPLTHEALRAAMAAATLQDAERLREAAQEIVQEPPEVSTETTVVVTVGWEIIAIVGIVVAGSVAKKWIDE